MGLQDKIIQSSIKARRKLLDYKILTSGSLTKVIRLKTTKNDYLDIIATDIISNDNIQVFLDIPENLPMERLRMSAAEVVAETQSIYFYDILPVIGYSQFDDNVEKGDIIIKKIYLDTERSNPFLLIVQVSEIIGNIQHGFLIFRKFNCAPYNFALSPEIQNIIDKFSEESEI